MKELIKLYQLAMKHGTPLLAYDRSQLEKNFRALSELRQKYPVRFLLAVKSFPHPQVLSLAQECGLSFDASNESEARLCPESAELIWLTDPSASISQKKSLPPPSSVVTIEQMEEFYFWQKQRKAPPLALRLNTSFLGRSSRFGMDLTNAPQLLELFKNSGVPWAGIHFHYGSEKNSAQDYLAMTKAALALTQEAGLALPRLNLGGGLHCLDLALLVEELSLFLQKNSPSTLLYFEPGRLLSENAGYAVGKILRKKVQPEREVITLDLSSLCHLNWSSPQLILTSLHRRPSMAQKMSFYGPSCYEGDLLGHYEKSSAPLPQLELGDLVFFKNISGYAHALNRSFNGVEAASTVFF